MLFQIHLPANTAENCAEPFQKPEKSHHPEIDRMAKLIQLYWSVCCRLNEVPKYSQEQRVLELIDKFLRQINALFDPKDREYYVRHCFHQFNIRNRFNFQIEL